MSDIRKYLGKGFDNLILTTFDKEYEKASPKNLDEMNAFYSKDKSYLVRQDECNSPIKAPRAVMAKRKIVLEILELSKNRWHGTMFDGNDPIHIGEVGACSGNMLIPLAELGFMIHYNDVKDSEYTSCFKWRMNRRCLNNYITYGHDELFPQETMDVVICWDVLEHCTNVNFVLHNILQALRPKGLLLLEYGWHERKEYPLLYEAMQTDDAVKKWLDDNFDHLDKNYKYQKK